MRPNAPVDDDVHRGAVALVRRRDGQRRQDDLDFRAVGSPDIDLPAVAVDIGHFAGNGVVHRPTASDGSRRRGRRDDDGVPVVDGSVVVVDPAVFGCGATGRLGDAGKAGRWTLSSAYAAG